MEGVVLQVRRDVPTTALVTVSDPQQRQLGGNVAKKVVQNSRLTLAGQEQHALRLVEELAKLVLKMRASKASDMAVLVETYNSTILELQGVVNTVTPIEQLCQDLVDCAPPKDWKDLDMFFEDINTYFRNFQQAPR
jgi:hypothetical protein